MLRTYNNGRIVVHRFNMKVGKTTVERNDILENKEFDKKLLELPMNDTGNARRVLLFCKDVIKFHAPENRWYYWNGKYWQSEQAELEIKNLVQAVMDRFEKVVNDSKLCADKLKEAKKFATNSNDSASISNTLTLIKNMNYVKEINSSKHYLNVQNGIVDLKTKKLYPHHPAYGCTDISPYKYNPDAKSSRFKEYMHEITDENKDIYNYLQVLTGYCATGSVKEQKFFVLLGNGANGKSKFLEAVHNVLGGYGTVFPVAALKSHKNTYAGEATPALVPLVGKRFSYTSELEKTDIMNDAIIKQLTGSPYMMVRMLRREYMKVPVTFKILIDTNHEPKFSHFDYAIERRMVVIPFTRKFEGKNRDNDIPEKLNADSEYILKWIIDGAYKYYQNGLIEPSVIEEATKATYISQDSVGIFVKEHLERVQGEEVQSSILYEHYKRFCFNAGFDAVDNRTFSQDMRGKGFERKEKRKGTFFLNVKLCELE